MIVYVSNVIRINKPTNDIKQWCQKNLTLVNPDFVKKQRMGFWTGNTPQTLNLYEVHGDTWVLPFGVLKQISDLLNRCYVHDGFKQHQIVDYGEGVPLYDYQRKAVTEAYKARYGILRSPAGSGKTQMGIALVMGWQRPALWLTHTQDLLRQSKERAERYMDKSLIGTITEGKVNIGKGITFATVQTMSKLDLTEYRDMWDVIVVDECHHVAGSPTSVTQFSKVLNALSARHKYGLSATVHRADGLIKATYALIGEVFYTVPDEAIADKIMKVGIRPIGTMIGPGDAIYNPDGTLNYTKLISYLCENEYRTSYISAHIVCEKERSCLILSDRLEHLKALMDSLPKDMRDKAAMIDGKMNSKKGKAEREQAIEDMRTSKKKYLFATYNLCKEGLDIPCLERLFLTTPVKDYAVVVQAIGRIARTCENKADPIAYDFVDRIPFCERAYHERLRHYKKVGAYLLRMS